VPEVGANLVGAAGKGASFKERGAVGVSAEDSEIGFGRESGWGDVAGAGAGWFGGDGGFAGKFL